MRAVVVFESMFGNTQKIADAVAEGLSGYVDTDLVEVGSAGGLDEGVALVVAGGPTHVHGLSRPGTRDGAVKQAPDGVVSKGIGLREWLESLPQARGIVSAAAFDTRFDKPGWLVGSDDPAPQAPTHQVVCLHVSTFADLQQASDQARCYRSRPNLPTICGTRVIAGRRFGCVGGFCPGAVRPDAFQTGPDAQPGHAVTAAPRTPTGSAAAPSTGTGLGASDVVWQPPWSVRSRWLPPQRRTRRPGLRCTCRAARSGRPGSAAAAAGARGVVRWKRWQLLRGSDE